jgi:dihydropteroate synthase
MTFIIGILNITPDSFFDGGRYFSLDTALKQTEKLVSEGAEIIDVGGESTRPGREPISVEEEIKRVIPVIKEIKKNFPQIPISIDSYKYEVVKQAVEHGAQFINDIYALRYSPQIVEILKNYPHIKVVLMHMLGTPKTMQINPQYPKGIVNEIKDFFSERINFLLENGVGKEQIILDPGIGFGKTTKHNIEILKKLEDFKQLTIGNKLFNFPLLIGLSRKSFIGKILGSEENPLPVEKRYEGTIVLHTYVILKKVGYIRAHDVKHIYYAKKLIELLS